MSHAQNLFNKTPSYEILCESTPEDETSGESYSTPSPGSSLELITSLEAGEPASMPKWAASAIADRKNFFPVGKKATFISKRRKEGTFRPRKVSPYLDVRLIEDDIRNSKEAKLYNRKMRRLRAMQTWIDDEYAELAAGADGPQFVSCWPDMNIYRSGLNRLKRHQRYVLTADSSSGGDDIDSSESMASSPEEDNDVVFVSEKKGQDAKHSKPWPHKVDLC